MKKSAMGPRTMEGQRVFSQRCRCCKYFAADVAFLRGWCQRVTWSRKVSPRCRAQVAGGSLTPRHSWKEKQKYLKLGLIWIFEKIKYTQLFGQLSYRLQWMLPNAELPV